MIQQGFFGIGIWHAKYHQNQGTLWRSAYTFGADFCFTIGHRFRKQHADTVDCWKSIPMLSFTSIDDLMEHLPYSCPLIGVELAEGARSLDAFTHPERACYLLGAEDHGLPPSVLERCHTVIQIHGLRSCLNVAVAGSLVMYDRSCKRGRPRTAREEFQEYIKEMVGE